MKRVTRNIIIVWRAERLIAQRRFAVLRKQMTAVAIAGLVGLFGLAMLCLAAYLALEPILGAPVAALAVAIANLVIALFLANWASGLSAEVDIAPVAEVRDIALEDLEAEAGDVADEVRSVVRDVRGIARNPMSVFSSDLLAPLIAALLKALRKS